MLRRITQWAERHTPTPENQAEKALNEMRMELFQAEQRVLDAQMHADYYRARLTFFEEVAKRGIEAVSDQRKFEQPIAPPLRPGLKLTAAQ
jgi:hypothetical protein